VQQAPKKTGKKRLTFFAKALTLFGVTAFLGIMSAAVWFVAIYEPNGMSNTQRIMKRQAELEKQRIAVEGEKVGELKPVEVVDYDPSGNGAENSKQVSRVIDGQLSTAWSTETYKAEKFSGLKDGVGFYFDYGAAASVQEISVDASRGWSGEIRGSNDLSEWATLCTVKNADQKTSLATESASYRYYLLWLTDLPNVEGQYRCKVFEMQAYGQVQ
jgi:hypothetical protein